MHELVNSGCQFIVASHAPIVLSYPNALIYRVDEAGLTRTTYDDLEHVSLIRDFLNDRERFVRRLLE